MTTPYFLPSDAALSQPGFVRPPLTAPRSKSTAFDQEGRQRVHRIRGRHPELTLRVTGTGEGGFYRSDLVSGPCAVDPAEALAQIEVFSNDFQRDSVYTQDWIRQVARDLAAGRPVYWHDELCPDHSC